MNVKPLEKEVTAERTRASLARPRLSLATPEIKGYYLRWFRGEPDRIQEALMCGYRKVKQKELVNFDHADILSKMFMSHDMSDDVSVLAGAGMTTDDGQSLRLYLMAIPEAYHEEDETIRLQENHKVLSALRVPETSRERYVPQAFQRGMKQIFLKSRDVRGEV